MLQHGQKYQLKMHAHNLHKELHIAPYQLYDTTNHIDKRLKMALQMVAQVNLCAWTNLLGQLCVLCYVGHILGLKIEYANIAPWIVVEMNNHVKFMQWTKFMYVSSRRTMLERLHEIWRIMQKRNMVFRNQNISHFEMLSTFFERRYSDNVKSRTIWKRLVFWYNGCSQWLRHSNIHFAHCPSLTLDALDI